MTTKHLITTFNQSLQWNALLYLTYKSTYLIRSLLLFSALNASYFSLWAQLLSIIFIALLWLDLGLRKALPFFLPHIHQQSTFINRIIITQLSLMMMTSPIIAWTAHNAISHTINDSSSLVILIFTVFILEGSINLARLISHAQHHHKQFNLAESFCLLLQMLIDIMITLSITNPTHLLIALFCNHLCTAILLIIMTRWVWHAKNGDDPKKEELVTTRDIIVHASACWGTTIIKSTTERNIVIPILAYTLGIEASNLFKLANDAALVIYRIGTKTIGVSDTSLLVNAQLTGKKRVVDFAFRVLTTQVRALCIPLYGILLILLCVSSFYSFSNDSTFFPLLIIMGVSYIAEIYLLPYERLIECARGYRFLYGAMIPYIGIYILYFLLIIGSTSIGLCAFACCIQGVRLVSCLFLVWFVRRGLVYTKEVGFKPVDCILVS